MIWKNASGLAALAIILCVLTASPSTGPQTADAKDQASQSAIRATLNKQVGAWNRGDVSGFMAGYWKSSETEFVGADGVLKGWQAVFDRYVRSYPDRKAMGHLTFSNLEIHVVCADAAFVVGEYRLQRANDSPAGVFTLNFRRFPEGWKIVLDHTSAGAAKTPPGKTEEPRQPVR